MGGGSLLDFEEDFLQTVRDTIATLNRRGVAATTFTANDQSITGWSVASNSQDQDKGDPTSGGYWEEYWHRSNTVLATDGTFWECGFWAEKSSTGRDEREEFLRQLNLSQFVGDTGKPFSKWKSELERIPYRGY